MQQWHAIGWATTAAGAMIALECRLPGSVLPRVPGWWRRVVAINLFQVALALVGGITWNAWMQGFSLFDASGWPGFAAVGATYFGSTFVFYWWHRIRHESALWWRAAHQLHHSASRLEVFTSFYKHPLEIAINAVLSAAICYPLMGCSPAQGAAYTLIIALAEMFYHWNVRTPRWIGALLQRPESHRLHHRRFHHTRNYGDLPLWDWLFGTFSNPSRADRVVCGFEPAHERSFGAMLAMREVDIRREPEPMSFRPACFGCSAKLRCAASRVSNAPAPSPAADR